MLLAKTGLSFACLIATAFRLRFLLPLICLPLCGWAFVFYPVGDNPLRWNVASGGAHTNIVNPATRAVRYFIASDAYSAANRNAEIAAIKACFDQWQSMAGSHLRFEFAGLISPEGLDVREDHTNVVFWTKNSLRVNGGQMNLSGLPAWTYVSFAADGSLLEADIVLNGVQYEWFTDFNNTTNQAQFIESVALHEIGHFIGLDHAVAGGTTIFAGGNGITAQAGLSADEIAAARFLYPSADFNWPRAAVQGTVRLPNGGSVFGAVVVADDAAGNLAAATITRPDGTYSMGGLLPGNYQLRVTPLDPPGPGADKLIRGTDVAPEYLQAMTEFSATTNIAITLPLNGLLHADLAVLPGPAFRITSVSKPASAPNLVSVFRHAVTLSQGQSNQFVAVSGRNLPSDAVLRVPGDGLSVGSTLFLEDRFGLGHHSLVASISVSSNAAPGLRSFVVSSGTNVAYANGFLEIAASIPDYNFDSFDDRFQRMFWTPWTLADSAPTADPDRDGFSNRFEYRTGTNPTNAVSHRLAIASIALTEGASNLTWETEIGRRYQLFTRTVLGAGEWVSVGRPLAATAGTMTFSEPAGGAAKFYRLGLEPVP